ncbi:hypothetical protein Cus16_2994 [Curtobacterium sp. ER1/6]|nr:hypothetical protein Cus16_2994 [Curtobacterium sp. ER1/6]
MVAGAHGDALCVEVLRDVVGVHAVDVERHEPGPRDPGGRTDDADAGHRGEALEHALRELLLVGTDPLRADRLQVPDGLGECHGLGHRLRARLEALGSGHELGRLHRHGGDHRPARAERGQRVEELAPTPEHADAARSEHLVPGERGEVDAELLHVERTVRRRLAGVEHDEGAVLVRGGDDLRHGRDHAGDVRHVREGDDPGPVGDARGRVVGGPRAVVGDRHPAERRTGQGRELLPRDEVRVVLGLGDEYLVARADAEPLGGGSTATPAGVGDAVRHEVEGVGGVRRPDDLRRRRRPDEAGDRGARVLVGVGAERRERVRATVHGRVVVLEEPSLGVEHLPRSLGRRPGVEVGERTPVHLLLEDREVPLDRGDLGVGQRLVRSEDGHPTIVVRRARSVQSLRAEALVLLVADALVGLLAGAVDLVVVLAAGGLLDRVGNASEDLVADALGLLALQGVLDLAVLQELLRLLRDVVEPCHGMLLNSCGARCPDLPSMLGAVHAGVRTGVGTRESGEPRPSARCAGGRAGTRRPPNR